MIKPYEAVNTFSRRPVVAQIVAYLVFIGEMLTFFICMYVNYTSTPRQIAILACYLTTVAAQVIITIRVSCIDPSDNIMISYRTDAQNRKNIKINECLYCDICVSYVKETSRHCKVCQRYCIELMSVARCVEDFDHHCMWINNCVGSKNYKEFMAMILVTLGNMITYVVGMILLWTENQWREYLGSMIALWVFSVVPVIFAILLFNLVALHIYLICNGITTYQFIMLQREEARRKKQEEERGKQVQMTENRHNTVVPVNKNLTEQQSNGQKSKQLVETSNQELPTENNFKPHQKSDIIFGNNDLSHESKTQKSINEPSTKQKKSKSNMLKISIQQNQNVSGQQEDYDEQPSPLNSKKQQSQVSVSRFFVKNKSIKFFIGDQIGSRPKSTMRMKEQTEKNMYHSVKVNRKQTAKNQSMHVTEVKNQNDFPQSKSSISLKAINSKK